DAEAFDVEMRVANARYAISNARSEAGKRGALARWQNGKSDGNGHGKTDSKTELCHDGKRPPRNSSSSLLTPPDQSSSSPKPSAALGAQKINAASVFQGGAQATLPCETDGKPDGQTVDVSAAFRAYAIAY